MFGKNLTTATEVKEYNVVPYAKGNRCILSNTGLSDKLGKGVSNM